MSNQTSKKNIEAVDVNVTIESLKKEIAEDRFFSSFTNPSTPKHIIDLIKLNSENNIGTIRELKVNSYLHGFFIENQMERSTTYPSIHSHKGRHEWLVKKIDNTVEPFLKLLGLTIFKDPKYAFTSINKKKLYTQYEKIFCSDYFFGIPVDLWHEANQFEKIFFGYLHFNKKSLLPTVLHLKMLVSDKLNSKHGSYIHGIITFNEDYSIKSHMILTDEEIENGNFPEIHNVIKQFGQVHNHSLYSAYPKVQISDKTKDLSEKLYNANRRVIEGIHLLD